MSKRDEAFVAMVVTYQPDYDIRDWETEREFFDAGYDAALEALEALASQTDRLGRQVSAYDLEGYAGGRDDADLLRRAVARLRGQE